MTSWRAHKTVARPRSPAMYLPHQLALTQLRVQVCVLQPFPLAVPAISPGQESTQQSLLVSVQNAHAPFFKHSALWERRAARQSGPEPPCGGTIALRLRGRRGGRTGGRWRRMGRTRSGALGCWSCPARRAWCAWSTPGWCGMSARCCGLWEERKGCRG